jgi:hypothetical protein
VLIPSREVAALEFDTSFNGSSPRIVRVIPSGEPAVHKHAGERELREYEDAQDSPSRQVLGLCPRPQTAASAYASRRPMGKPFSHPHSHEGRMMYAVHVNGAVRRCARIMTAA